MITLHDTITLQYRLSTEEEQKRGEREGEEEEGRNSLISMSTDYFRIFLFKSCAIHVQLNFIHPVGIANTRSALEKKYILQRVALERQ